ncbi:MAG: helix-turn-helix domain-containing protein, partial [Lachnospiraceae bacterium]|nr:helix-turn-helix domain-containing protein [Lachnospiraceae bacterium]
MTHAYDKLFLEHSRKNLAAMFDFAVYGYHFELSSFFDLFLASGIAAHFGAGNPTFLVGRSGSELVYEVLDRCGLLSECIKPSPRFSRSPEYWAGWALAYYQWECGLSFAEITKHVPINTILNMYDPYHEMDILQFVDRMNELMRLSSFNTCLKQLRKQAHFSQSELAAASGIPVRTIQQYEQRRKDINRASAETVFLLARALNCNVEELMEKAGSA